MFTRERGGGGEDEGAEADLRRAMQRGDMGIGGILDREAAVKQLIGLQILARGVAWVSSSSGKKRAVRSTAA
jgi:hypothetical protein